MKNNEMLKAWGEKDEGAPLEMVRVGFRSGLVFSDGSKGKESTCNAGDTGDRFDPCLGRSPEEGNATSLPEKFHRQRSLAVYSPKGHRESDMTEQVSTHTQV